MSTLYLVVVGVFFLLLLLYVIIKAAVKNAIIEAKKELDSEK